MLGCSIISTAAAYEAGAYHPACEQEIVAPEPATPEQIASLNIRYFRDYCDNNTEAEMLEVIGSQHTIALQEVDDLDLLRETFPDYKFAYSDEYGKRSLRLVLMTRHDFDKVHKTKLEGGRQALAIVNKTSKSVLATTHLTSGLKQEAKDQRLAQAEQLRDWIEKLQT